MYSLPSFRGTFLIKNKPPLGAGEEHDREVVRTIYFAIIAMAVLILFITSAVNSWKELKYTLYGVQVNAHITSARIFRVRLPM